MTLHIHDLITLIKLNYNNKQKLININIYQNFIVMACHVTD